MVNISFEGRTSRSDRPVTLVILVFALFLVICTFWFFASSVSNSLDSPVTLQTSKSEAVVVSTDSSLSGTTSSSPSSSANPDDLCRETQEATFYDDPTLGYSIDDKPIKNWDEKRRQWLKIHPSFSSSREKILLVTGSNPRRCPDRDGDNLLLRLFKNKVDYCRIQGHEIYYSNTYLNPKMKSFWVKLPVIYAAMLAHPGSEWIWWVDSDAVFTDMGFSLPLTDYKDYNMVLPGWPHDVYEKKSWTGLNTGVVLVRNCQWTMDFLQEWASIGPISPDFDKWDKIARSVLSDKTDPYLDDQSAMAYLLVTRRKKWGDKILLEGWYLQVFWPEVAEKFENITESHARTEASVGKLRRRRSEAETVCYVKDLERNIEFISYNDGDTSGKIQRRPFVTHFCGCKPCSGTPNAEFEARVCSAGIEKALNFADNQVLRSYGFVHKDLSNVEDVLPLPFDYLY